MNTDGHRWGKRGKLLLSAALLLLAGVVFWVVRDGQRGPVEVSFKGMKTLATAGGKSQMALFRVKNNSARPISYYSFTGRKPSLIVHEFELRGRQMDMLQDAAIPWYHDWCTLNPGEVIEVEQHIASRNRFWDVEMRYVEGEQKGMAVLNEVQDSSEWKTARSGSLWPVNWRL